MRALASCSTRQAMVENSSAHNSAKPKLAPAEAAVVTVPGPMKAAEITDQNSTLHSRFTGRFSHNEVCTVEFAG